MKKWSRTCLAVLCLCIVLGVTACGTGNDTVRDDAANDTTTDQNNAGNAIDDMGNAIDDGVNAVGDGMENMVDDLTGNNNANNDITDSNVNDATENSRTRKMN